MKLYIFLFSLCCTSSLNSQVRGCVIDGRDKSPLSGVNIYLQRVRMDCPTYVCPSMWGCSSDCNRCDGNCAPACEWDGCTPYNDFVGCFYSPDACFDMGMDSCFSMDPT